MVGGGHRIETCAEARCPKDLFDFLLPYRIISAVRPLGSFIVVI
jgi:hypothetical protein